MNAPSSTRLTPGKGLLVLIGVNVAVFAYVALCELFGFTAVWAGFLFGLYWGAFEHMKPERLLASIGGPVLGLLLAFLLNQAPLWIGTAGVVIVTAVIFFVLYCLFMQWLPLVVNSGTMLFLLVGTIPEIQKHGDFGHMFGSLAIGIIFMTGLYAIAMRLQRRSAKAAAV